MGEKVGELDIEIHFKDTFRVFSKDRDGECNTRTKLFMAHDDFAIIFIS